MESIQTLNAPCTALKESFNANHFFCSPISSYEDKLPHQNVVRNFASLEAIDLLYKECLEQVNLSKISTIVKPPKEPPDTSVPSLTPPTSVPPLTLPPSLLDTTSLTRTVLQAGRYAITQSGMSSSDMFLSIGYGTDGIFKDFQPYVEIEGYGEVLLKLQYFLIQNNSPAERLKAIQKSLSARDIVTDNVQKHDKIYASIRISLGKYGFDCKTDLPHSTPTWKKIITILWSGQVELMNDDHRQPGSSSNINEGRPLSSPPELPQMPSTNPIEQQTRSLGNENVIIIANMITEFKNRLNSELSSRTDDIAANVVNMVMRKLRSNGNFNINTGPDNTLNKDMTRSMNHQFQNRTVPQDVRIADAQPQSGSHPGPVCHYPTNDQAGSKHARHEQYYAHDYKQGSRLPPTNGMAPTSGLHYHQDTQNRVFPTPSNPHQSVNIEANASETGPPTHRFDDPNAVLARDEDYQIK